MFVVGFVVVVVVGFVVVVVDIAFVCCWVFIVVDIAFVSCCAFVVVALKTKQNNSRFSRKGTERQFTEQFQHNSQKQQQQQK